MSSEPGNTFITQHHPSAAPGYFLATSPSSSSSSSSSSPSPTTTASGQRGLSPPSSMIGGYTASLERDGDRQSGAKRVTEHMPETRF